MTGVTSTGFKFEINDNIKNDWRFLSAVARAESADESDLIQGYAQLVLLLLGKDGERQLCKHVQQEDGSVPVELVNKEVLEIIQAMGKSEKK